MVQHNTQQCGVLIPADYVLWSPFFIRQQIIMLILLLAHLCRGGEGIDFDVNLGITNVDFGTFHVSLPLF